MRAMQCFVLMLLAGVTLGLCAAEEKQPIVSESDLKQVFDSVEAVGTNCVFTFKKTGARFVYSINNSEYRVNKYGESIVLGNNAELKISERHFDISFSSLSDRKDDIGYSIVLRSDFRSMCGNVRTNCAYLVSAKEMSNRACETDDRCLFGLKIVPAE